MRFTNPDNQCFKIIFTYLFSSDQAKYLRIVKAI